MLLNGKGFVLKPVGHQVLSSWSLASVYYERKVDQYYKRVLVTQLRGRGREKVRRNRKGRGKKF